MNDLPTTATGTLAQLPETKAEIMEFSDYLIKINACSDIIIHTDMLTPSEIEHLDEVVTDAVGLFFISNNFEHDDIDDERDCSPT